MHDRTLGRTGVQVSTLVLGAMNFGALGRTTQDDATAIVDADDRNHREQPGYSILQRAVETDVLPVTEQYGMGVLVRSPLASGWLPGAVRKGREVTTNRASVVPHYFDRPSRPTARSRTPSSSRPTSPTRRD